MHEETSVSRSPSDGTVAIEERAGEWRRRLAFLALGWLAFETLSGLSIYLLPFSVPNQWMVVVHTAIGLAALVPALIYLIRHLAIYWSRQLTGDARRHRLGRGADDPIGVGIAHQL
jgi:hypothetical protein